MAESLQEQLQMAFDEGVVDATLRAEEAAGLPRGLLLAVAAQTPPRRTLGEWLLQRAGTPDLEEAARYVAGLLAAGEAFGRANGVDARDSLKFAISAFGVTPETALVGYRRGDSDLETQGGRYGAATLVRLAAVQEFLDTRLPLRNRPRLEPGAVSDAVVEVKRLLREWYAATGSSPPRRMRGPVYGTTAVEAVRAFQCAMGITVDGIVGEETWMALAKQRDDRAA